MNQPDSKAPPPTAVLSLYSVGINAQLSPAIFVHYPILNIVLIGYIIRVQTRNETPQNQMEDHT